MEMEMDSGQNRDGREAVRPGCPHPCGLRVTGRRDIGWGDMAFAYEWDSSSGLRDGQTLPDLDACVLFEVTSYGDNVGHYAEGWFYPPDPPFAGWRFRDPTDGRTAPVGMECFSASLGRAWDRHKRAGRLIVPVDVNSNEITNLNEFKNKYKYHNVNKYQNEDAQPIEFLIVAVQRYWFRCDRCGTEQPLCPPHHIERRFERMAVSDEIIWRYSLRKHGHEAYLDIGVRGYIGDSANVGFGPWDNETGHFVEPS